MGGCDGDGEKEAVSDAELSPTSIILEGAREEGKEGNGGRGKRRRGKREGRREIRRLSEAKQRPINGTKRNKYFYFFLIDRDRPTHHKFNISLFFPQLKNKRSPDFLIVPSPLPPPPSLPLFLPHPSKLLLPPLSRFHIPSANPLPSVSAARPTFHTHT
jgi:hypothetical protein